MTWLTATDPEVASEYGFRRIGPHQFEYLNIDNVWTPLTMTSATSLTAKMPDGVTFFVGPDDDMFVSPPST